MPELKERRTERLPAKRRHRLGIVLSGGGSRGVAHIGVLRALHEHGIEPDCIAGVSAGAIVGALEAAGHTPAAMLEFFRTIDPFRLAHVTFGKPGLLDTLKFVEEFRRYFPDDSFERLHKKLYVLATDLLSGEATVFESGRLVLPLLASSSVPMVYSPTEIGGRLYADGGIVDNFPVKLLEGRCDVIIGVHVSPIREMTATELDSSLSVLDRSLEVGMFTHSKERFARCDLVVLPKDLIRFGMFDTTHFDDIEAAGHEAALARMGEIARVLKAPGR